MTLTLDPRYPLVWRTPDSLQLGVDDPPVVLDTVTLGHERLLAALQVGLTAAGLTLIGTESGLSVAQIEDFRRVIQPALLERGERPSARVDVSGTSITVDRLMSNLAGTGLDARPARPVPELGDADSGESDAAIAVVVGHFVLDPLLRGTWLRRDIPHLPVIFGDTGVLVGPMIEPGIGPCLYCLELHHRDADPQWPAIASQLLGQRSRAETPVLASEIAALATRMILNRLAGTAHAEPSSVRLEAETGALSRRPVTRHPDCACGVTWTGASVPRGIGTARSFPSADPSSPPRTTAAVSVPA